jgi:hypothetical protein
MWKLTGDVGHEILARNHVTLQLAAFRGCVTLETALLRIRPRGSRQQNGQIVARIRGSRSNPWYAKTSPGVGKSSYTVLPT